MRINTTERGIPFRCTGRGLAVVAAVLLTNLTPTAHADECADFYAALATESAALEVWHHYDQRHPEPKGDDLSPEAVAQRKVRDSLNGASIDATFAVAETAKALRESIEPRDVREIVDAIAGIRLAYLRAFRALSQWQLRTRDFLTFDPVDESLESIQFAASEALHEALKVACRLGVARSGE